MGLQRRFAGSKTHALVFESHYPLLHVIMASLQLPSQGIHSSKEILKCFFHCRSSSGKLGTPGWKLCPQIILNCSCFLKECLALPTTLVWFPAMARACSARRLQESIGCGLADGWRQQMLSIRSCHLSMTFSFTGASRAPQPEEAGQALSGLCHS